MKTCPQCHTENPDDVKFCGECGTRLPAQAIASASGIAIGDKNTIAGDIVGHQELYRITGNATIVKNEDETKKVVKCHCCGRKLSVAESYECPHCGEATCQDCFDREFGACRSCRNREIGKRESAYREALTRALADGIVNGDERRELNSLRDKLGIDEDRAEELENEIRSNRPGMRPVADRSSPLTTFESIALKNAAIAFYEELDSSKAERLIAPVYGQHDENEQVVGLYVAILTDRDAERAEELITSLKVDLLDVKLALFDMHFRSGDMMAAEKALLDVERLWPDNLLVKTRRIVFSTRFAELTSDTSFLDIARGLLETLGNPSGPMESSWVERAKHVVSVYGQFDEGSKSREQCKTEGLYWGIVSGRLSAPERTYRIEIRGQFGSVSPMMVSAAIKEDWEKSSENSFEENVGQFVSGKMDEDDLPFSEMLPFEGGDLSSFDGRIGGLVIPDQDEMPWSGMSLTVVDDKGCSKTVKDDDLRSLVQAQENEPLPQLTEDRAALVIETKISVKERIIEINTSEAIDPSQLGLRIHSISVLNEQKRKQTVRIIDVVQWEERALEPEPSDSGENETVCRVFWWIGTDDIETRAKSATSYLTQNPKVANCLEQWRKSVPDIFVPDEKKNYEDQAAERFVELLESNVDSDMLLTAAEQGVEQALMISAKGAWCKTRGFVGFQRVHFAPCWKRIPYETALRRLAVLGDAESQFLLGWYLEQVGNRTEAVEWYRELVSGGSSFNSAAVEYARVRCAVQPESVDDILLHVKVSDCVASRTGSFAGLAELEWGFYFKTDESDTYVGSWREMGQDACRSEIYAYAKRRLDALDSDDNPECEDAQRHINRQVGSDKIDMAIRNVDEDEFGYAADLMEEAEALGIPTDNLVERFAIAVVGNVNAQKWLYHVKDKRKELVKRIVLALHSLSNPDQYAKAPAATDVLGESFSDELDGLEGLCKIGVEDRILVAVLAPLAREMWTNNRGSIIARGRLFGMFQCMAEKGDVTSMWYIAHFHQRGFGTEKAGKRAKEWARKATEAGVADPFGPEDVISTDSAVQHVFRLFGKR